MASPDDLEQQRALLQAYRRSLAMSLEQLAQHGSPFAPPALLSHISEARAQIQRIKAHLRQHGIVVEDHLLDSEAAREPPARGLIRSAAHDRWISAAALVLLLVLGLGIWRMLPVVLRPSLPIPTTTVAGSPEPSPPTSNPSLPSSAALDPRNWWSLVRVTSPAFFDGNTCFLAKELPESIHPDRDPATVQAQVKQIQDARRVPVFTSSNGITIPLHIANIVKDGEAIILDPKMVVTVHVKQPVSEHIDAITNCGGMGAGTHRNFSGVSLVQTANVEQYKVPISAAGDFFYAEPGIPEIFQVPLICSSPGIYSIQFELPYTYANQSGVIVFNSPEIICPKSYTLWLFAGENQPLRRMASYTLTGSGYERKP